jgi:hypothetical protein
MPTQVTSDVIADGNLNTQALADSSVTAAKLANNAVTTAKITDANVTPAKLSQPLTLGTVQNSTSGTSIPFTGIPNWVKRITVSLNGVSLSGSALIRFRLGPAGGLATSGYLGAGSVISSGAATVNQTAGFDIYTNVPSAAYVYHGSIIFTLVDAANNIWAAKGVFATSSVAWTHTVAGVVPLSGTLTQLAVTTSNGTDTFDAGSINILYE